MKENMEGLLEKEDENCLLRTVHGCIYEPKQISIGSKYGNISYIMQMFCSSDWNVTPCSLAGRCQHFGGNYTILPWREGSSKYYV